MDSSELYVYVLRAVVLAQTLSAHQPAFSEEALPCDKGEPSSARRIALASLSELFKESKSSTSTRYPEKLLKSLLAKVEQISKGEDPAYSEMSVRYTMGAYYGKLKDDNYLKSLKENRTLETLILGFVSTATEVLKRRLGAEEWQSGVNDQVDMFVRVIRDCLRTIKHVSLDLEAKLASLSTSIANSQTRQKDATRGHVDPSDGDGETSVLLVSLAELFAIDLESLRRDIKKQEKKCSSDVVFADLKKLINYVAHIPLAAYTRIDFASELALKTWRSAELDNLQQMVLLLIGHDPSIVYSKLRTEAQFQELEAADHTELEVHELVRPLLVCTPINPRLAYSEMLNKCLALDLNKLAHLDPDAEVSLRILSRTHQEILSACALRWRCSRSQQWALFLHKIVELYIQQEVPVECVLEALADEHKLIAEETLDLWQMTDSQMAVSAMSLLASQLLGALSNCIEELICPKPSPHVRSLLKALDAIEITTVSSRINWPENFESWEVSKNLHQALRSHCESIFTYFKQQMSHHKLDAYLEMADWILCYADKLRKVFPKPILNLFDMLQAFLHIVTSAYYLDLAYHLASYSQIADMPEKVASDTYMLFRLYQIATNIDDLSALHLDPQPSSSALSTRKAIESFIRPYIDWWLEDTRAKTTAWVAAAINADQFEAESPHGHSSSVTDLIASCKSAITFMQQLKWQNRSETSLFFTKLSAIVSQSIEQYSVAIERLFLQEMQPELENTVEDPEQTRSAWLNRARELYQPKAVEAPQIFHAQSCIKLNNIQSARALLDQLYQLIDVDAVKASFDERQPSIVTPYAISQFLFSVKVVLGEHLSAASSSARIDPFVTLSNESGFRLAKTRTLYDTNDPRWAETFDISVNEGQWIAATVWNRKLVDQHELCGRAFLHLNPPSFNDCLLHDLWLDLDNGGRLLLRISMEGEKNDAQFWFGCAFRSLKRAESDMTRVIIDRLSTTVRRAISRANLTTLAKKKTAFAAHRVKVEGLSANPLHISTPSSQISDTDIEEPLKPLFEMLDLALEVFRKYLSEPAWKLVISKIWKECLQIVEDLLVPPLSDRPSKFPILTEQEVDFAFKWLKFLVDFFHAGGDGVPMTDLHTGRYHSIITVRYYYDLHTDKLMEECVRLIQAGLKQPSRFGLSRSKSVYTQRNLGTIKQYKQEKKPHTPQAEAEIVLRVLRLRSGTTEFITQQLRTLEILREGSVRLPVTSRKNDTRSKVDRKYKQLGHGTKIPGF